MPSDKRFLDAICRRDLPAFVRLAFEIIWPGREFHDAAYIGLICDRLIQVKEGNIRNLIINIPPRHLKSFIASVCYPAWLLGRDPSMKIMAVSHNERLAEQLHADFRKLVDSPRFRDIFPGFRVSASANTKDNLETVEGGGRRAISVDSSPTGLGADLILLDDPLNPSDASSPEMCEYNADQLTRSIFSRKNSPSVPVILVQQRLSPNDSTSVFQNRQDWHQLSLPLVAVEDECYPLSNGLTYRRSAGEILSPDHMSAEGVESLRLDMAGHFEAQYQQNPAAARGTIISEADLSLVGWLPHGLDYAISMDTAPNGAAGASRTAILVIGRADHLNYVAAAIARKLEFSEILDLTERLAETYGARRILVESTGIGPSVIAELQKRKLLAMPCKTGNRDKRQRLEAVIGRFKSGDVAVLGGQPWTREFCEELLGFPYAPFDDQVDALTQYLAWVQNTLASGHPPVVVGVSSGLTAHVHRMNPYTREAGLERQVPRGFRGWRGR